MENCRFFLSLLDGFDKAKQPFHATVFMQIKLINRKSANRGLENWIRPLAGIKPGINKQIINVEVVISS
jgi:hypothetical protein